MAETRIPDFGGSDLAPDAIEIGCPCENWVEVSLFDPSSVPEAGAPYRIFDAASDGMLSSGTLNADGSSGVVPLPLDVAATYVEFGPAGDSWVLGETPVAYDGVLSQRDGEDEQAWLQRLSDAKQDAHALFKRDQEAGYAALEELNTAGRAELGLYEDLSLTARSPGEAAEILRRQKFDPEILTHPAMKPIPNVDAETAFYDPSPWVYVAPDGAVYGWDASDGLDGPDLMDIHGKVDPRSREGFLSNMVRITDDELDYLSGRLDGGGTSPQAPASLGSGALGAISDFLVSPAAAQSNQVPPGAARAIRRARGARAGGKVSQANSAAPKKAAAVKTGNKFTTSKVRRFDVECFYEPVGGDSAEFLRQLAEQETTINQTSADELVARRDAIAAAREAGKGTDSLRDRGAQDKARRRFERTRRRELKDHGLSARQVDIQLAGELRTLAATHRLDIIAGGDPSDVSMGKRDINSSIGPQWRGRQADSLEKYAREMQDGGKGTERMNVKLRKC